MHAIFSDRALCKVYGAIILASNHIGGACERIKVIQHRIEWREGKCLIGAMHGLITSTLPSKDDAFP
jgi:hypothetical protein